MKMYLMTPGPTPVAPETQLAMAQPIIHHRSPQFMEILGEVRAELRAIEVVGERCRRRQRKEARPNRARPNRARASRAPRECGGRPVP